MNKSTVCISTLLFFLLFLLACGNEDDLLPLPMAEEGEELSGGGTTVFDASANAFALPAPSLSNAEELLFGIGNSFFNLNWVTAPASTTARDGLGPYFNSRSCSGCHFRDGRGRPPAFDGENNHGLLLRLSVDGTSLQGAPLPHAIYGGQLQDRAIPGMAPEGRFTIRYETIEGRYDDGTPYTLRRPTYHIDDLSLGDLGNVKVSPRVGAQMIGLGLLEAVEEATILSFADEADVDGDGISGKANYVWEVEKQQLSLGRFGWKANEPTLLQQTAGAFLGDMGITSDLFPDENCLTRECEEQPHGGLPEIEEEKLRNVALYVSTLAVPARRDHEDPEVLQGKQLFIQLQCTSCHIPKMTTGIHSIPALSNQSIRPYTDLLLHDMGEGLADHREDFRASGREWRTPPLWGLGLIETVNEHTFLLHDGRARNIEEAILWHGGEAENAQKAFKALSNNQREQLLRFLESL
ncbi:MAG: di-heme oxidoredictase family protein [Bacteroidota bacterium]